MRLRTLTHIAIILAITAIIMSTIALVRPGRAVEEAPAATPTTTEQIFVVYDSQTPQTSGSMLYYPMTDEDRALVEMVVTAEAVGEPYEGQMAVAQCILNTAQARNLTPGEVVKEKGQYATPAKAEDVTESAREAVSAVFDRGETVTDAPIRYFYAPARCYSKWHEESLVYICEIGGHRFFAEEGAE